MNAASTVSLDGMPPPLSRTKRFVFGLQVVDTEGQRQAITALHVRFTHCVAYVSSFSCEQIDRGHAGLQNCTCRLHGSGRLPVRQHHLQDRVIINGKGHVIECFGSCVPASTWRKWLYLLKVTEWQVTSPLLLTCCAPNHYQHCQVS